MPYRLLRIALPPIIAAALLVVGCAAPDASAPYSTAALHEGVVLERIAFGSCNREDLPQPLWAHVLAHDPDLWMWLGDNIYADTEDMDEMAAKYAAQRANEGYRQLVRTTPVVGTWDDHDYGLNDAGKEYAKRDSSQQLFLDFLGVPEDDPRREREGVYAAHTYGPEGRRVKVILLDTRYHRDSLATDPDPNRRYRPRPDGDVLGEAQWAWLERELRTSDAQVHLIGSSVQVIPEEHGWEKWANLPAARERLFRLLRETQVPGVVLLSGDRHLAELSRRDDVLDYPLYDLTSSGLTHSYEDADEPNRYRVGPLYGGLNYGLIEIDWDAEPATITLQVRGEGGEVVIEETVALNDLQPAT